MRTISRDGWSALWACFGILVAGASSNLQAAQEDPSEVFKLREISVFDLEDSNFLRGQSADCREAPWPEVQAYPEFRSKNPLFGRIYLGGEYGQARTGTCYHFAADESQGTGKGFDRLHLDLNRDLDLRNDSVLKAQARPPSRARWQDSNLRQQVIFEFLNVPFDFGPAGIKSVQLMPRLTVAMYPGNDKVYKQVTFVRTDVRQGEIKIGGQKYKAILGNDYVILGRLDAPGTALSLSATGGSREPSSWWGGDRLMAMHKKGDRYFVCSATPTGGELRVRPYTGELGTFEIGAGGRKVDTMTARGSLQSAQAAVAIGSVAAQDWPEPSRTCTVPAGDYLPSYLTIRLGRLQIAVSQNYHSDGKPLERSQRPRVYGISIRKDKPFVLDFSDKPEVMFASPARDLRLKRGEQLEVKAVLVDPKLDIMIRGLEDTTRKRAQDRDGQFQRNLSLDPTVIITRTNGEKVGEGTMPFG